MEPFQKFDWSVRCIRTILNKISQDVFQENYQKGFAFYMQFVLWILSLICYLSTIVIEDDHFDYAIRFLFAAMFLGVLQVN